MRVTIKDIAEKTGLSVSTVSLVLNHKKHRISEETCARVWEAARTLGYRPNQLAVSLVTRRSKTLGLMIPDITNAFFAEIARAAEAQSQQSGYSVILCNTNNDPQKDIDYIHILTDRGIDGVIYVMAIAGYQSQGAACLDILRRMETPVIMVDRFLPDEHNMRVLTDNAHGGYLATKHLLALGHRRIGCITGPMGASSQQRLFGYIRALQEHGIAFDPALTREGDYRTGSGYRLTGELLEKGVSAIFACNDMMAYGVYKRAIQAGRCVPQSLSIVGYDDLPFSEIMEIPLTTVRQPTEEMGAYAAKKLIAQIEGDSAGCDMTFQPELIVRKSTAQAARASSASMERDNE